MSLFNWVSGTHPLLRKAREQCAKITGLESVLLNLTQFNPEVRSRYHELLKSPLFAPLCVQEKETGKPSYKYTVDVNKIREVLSRDL